VTFPLMMIHKVVMHPNVVRIQPLSIVNLFELDLYKDKVEVDKEEENRESFVEEEKKTSRGVLLHHKEEQVEILFSRFE